MNGNGEVSRSGYLFKMFLPADGGSAVEELDGGVFNGDVNTDLAETTWCAYTWPANYGNSGNRTFFVNQAGDITATDDPGNTGTGGVLRGGAGSAFQVGGLDDSITGQAAVGTVGRDANTWRQVN